MEREHDEYEFKEFAKVEDESPRMRDEQWHGYERDCVDAENRRAYDFINNR